MKKRTPGWLALGLAGLGGLLAAMLAVATYRGPSVTHPPTDQQDDLAVAAAPAISSTATARDSLLHGRVTTDDGAVYEGRLRFGGAEEALWGDYFNGFKATNPWAVHASAQLLPKERDSIAVFGIDVTLRERQIDLGRPFMARFGDITRIESHGRDIQVALKSGTLIHLDRWAADDLADGLRVWDERRGVVDIAEHGIRSIELLPTPRIGAAPQPLYGTVRTRHGDYTGFVQWDRQDCLGSDLLEGRAADGEIGVRFDALRSIARHSTDSSLVTLADGREMLLSGSRDVGGGNRGIYVDDRRYGRVLISWNAFERVDFSSSSRGPAYGDFPPGRLLTGSVTTRDGRRIVGRLVFDLDESETTDTLDAPFEGVDYTLPFGLVAAIALPAPEKAGRQRAAAILHSGEELTLELAGDLGRLNAGLLVFGAGQRPEYVPWGSVERVDFDRPKAMYPMLDAGEHAK